MTEYGNGDGEFENAVHGIEKMRISNGDNRQIKQNGPPPAYTQGQRGGRNNRQPRNGHVQPNRAAYAGASQNGSGSARGNEYPRANANDAQLKTGYALHQDPAIISFSGAGGVPPGPMGAPIFPAQPQPVAANAGVVPFGPPPSLAGSGYVDPHVDAMLPSNYKRNFNMDTPAQAYGSYLHQSAPNAPPMQDRRPAGRRPFERRPVQGYRTQETRDDRLPNAGTFDAEDNDVMPGDPQGAAGQSTRPGYVINKKGVYVRGLDQQTTDADLRARFEPFGIVTQCKVHVDLRTRACLGYGFVEFAEEQSARAAIDAFAGEPPGCMQVSTMRMPAPDMTNVYVRNLPLNLSDRDLEGMFTAFGKVVSVRILRHPNNVSQGVGFARMSSQSECERIIETYNGCCLPGSPQPLVVKFADDSSGKRFKQRTEQDRFPPAAAAYDRPRPPRADEPQHPHPQVAAAQRSSTVPNRGHHHPHFNARNGSYQLQSGYQHGSPPNAYHPHAESASSAPPPPNYPPPAYHAPSGPTYQPPYQPGGYYQAQAFPPPANFPPYAPASFEQPPNGMYQQPPAPPGYHPPAVDGPPPFAPANYNNVPVSNMYMCASAHGQPPIANGTPHTEANMHNSRPNTYGTQPPATASPYVDPAIISVRNTTQK